MRIGICSPFEFGTGEADSIRRFEAIAAAGFDYLETQLAPLVELSEDEFRRFTRRLDMIRLPCRASLLLFPRNTVLVGKEVDMAFLREFTGRASERAASLGCELIVFGHGKNRSYSDPVSKEEALSDMTKILTMASEVTGMYGIRIAIEPLNRGETNIFNTYAEAIDIVRKVGDPYLGALCDWYHARLENQPPKEMKIMPEKLFHLHIAYPEGRTVPSAKDDMAMYAPFFNVIREMGYNNKISIEAKMDKNADFAAVVREGYTTLKRLLTP